MRELSWRVAHELGKAISCMASKEAEDKGSNT